MSTADDPTSVPGRLIKAPENFLSRDGVRTVFGQAKAGRRDFIRSAFAAAAAGTASQAAWSQANPVPAEGGDPNILTLPAHTTGLGQGVDIVHVQTCDFLLDLVAEAVVLQKQLERFGRGGESAGHPHAGLVELADQLSQRGILAPHGGDVGHAELGKREDVGHVLAFGGAGFGRKRFQPGIR